MKCFTWNCRGMYRSDFSGNFIFLCSLVRVDLFCLLETKVALDKVHQNFYGRFFDQNYCRAPARRAGGICLFCNDTSVSVMILKAHDRFIHCQINELSTNMSYFITFVYAFLQKNLQDSLWEEILVLNPLNQHWCLLGDFNNIIDLS